MTDRAGRSRHRLRFKAIFAAAASLTASVPASAQLAQAQITGLSDIVIGTIGSFTSDVTRSETVCAFSSGALLSYHVTATGNGPGFVLKSTLGGSLPYEVQWNQAANQTSGTTLTSGVALNGQTAQTLLANCLLGSSGSLTVILRSAALTAASAGDYSGTLTILLAPN
jgi:hypothetical protein